ALKVVDRAIQVFGGAGVSQDFPLAEAYAHLRALRLADGPDEVHNRTIARLEMKKYQDLTQAGEGELKTLDVPRS
ncbi:MAG: acyl-CoA dehydrogenase family protein, partial [Pseudomonadota bacterium]|nr:acyl-CoA dehydrogenase family protein [Pseudomonadota bacterium]